MFDNPYITGILLLLVAVVVIYALVKNYNIKLKAGDYEATLKPNSKPKKTADVAVGTKLEIEGEVGNVKGLKTDDVDIDLPNVGVLNEAKISKSAKTGDIVGLEITSSTKKSGDQTKAD